ncbi:MAG: GNAT family N-acetyltransferase [Rubrimonas sp.]|uniref:GNAT family N-acetyltransferase n=1 Tax=Rubrimonas sp. TaxID=2036015 RepID=UPI002FDD730F
MFETDRLAVRRYRPADLAAHLRLRADPLVRQFMHWAEDEAAWPRRVVEAAARHPFDGRGWINLAVARRRDGAVIGDHGLRVEGGEAFIGLALLPEARRCGFGAELVRGATRWLAASGVGRCVAEIDFGNAASFGLFERAGFRTLREGRDAFGPFAVMFCDLAAAAPGDVA